MFDLDGDLEVDLQNRSIAKLSSAAFRQAAVVDSQSVHRSIVPEHGQQIIHARVRNERIVRQDQNLQGSILKG